MKGEANTKGHAGVAAVMQVSKWATKKNQQHAPEVGVNFRWEPGGCKASLPSAASNVCQSPEGQLPVPCCPAYLFDMDTCCQAPERVCHQHVQRACTTCACTGCCLSCL